MLELSSLCRWISGCRWQSWIHRLCRRGRRFFLSSSK